MEDPQAKIRYTWQNMIARCCKPEYRDYPRYGGRGITVCDRWRTQRNFIDDMLDSMLQHIKKHGFGNTTLDRTNPTKGYSPNNCAWKTWKKQVINRKVSQVDSTNLVLVSLANQEEYQFFKIADAARFLPGGYDSNRRAIHEYIHGNRCQIKGFWIYSKQQLTEGGHQLAMRDQIHAAIMEGGATKESLLELTGTTEKGLASQFTYLRMTGKCPKKQEDGTFTIISEEEWAEYRSSSKGAAGKILTPSERADKAQKREKRASSAFTNAEKRAEANPDDTLLQLTLTKYDAELQIAGIMLGRAEEELRNAPPEEVVEASTDEEVPEDVEMTDEELEATTDPGYEEEDGDLE